MGLSISINDQAAFDVVIGVPGPAGPAGPQGPQGVQGEPGVGVPVGGTAGQVLAKIDGVDYNTEWVDVTDEFAVWGKITGTLSAQLDLQQALDGKYSATNPAGFITSSALAPYLTSAAAANTYYLKTNPDGYITSGALTGYATQSWVTTQLGSYATIASLGTAAYQPTSYWIQSPAVAATDGQIPAWDAATSRPIWIDNSARTLFLVGSNKTGSTIPKGAAVYVSGGQGGFPTISLAKADAESTSARTIGVTTEAIANNGQGNVVVGGSAIKLDTSAYAEGQILYLSATVAGGFTTTLPTQPLHGVVIGIVTRSSATVGVIEVTIQNYQELGELSDVLISGKANNDLLAWDSASSVWKNKTFSTLGLETSAHAASTYYLASNPSGYITSSSLSPYLTSATAASTYQTIAGMSSYLTTSAAASTYLTQANAASTYQTQSGMSSYLAKADNLSGLASTSTARSNLGLGSLATLNDAPADGQTYGRNNGAWVVAGGGGGGTKEVKVVSASSYAVIPSDYGKIINLTSSSNGKVYLPMAPAGSQVSFSQETGASKQFEGDTSAVQVYGNGGATLMLQPLNVVTYTCIATNGVDWTRWIADNPFLFTTNWPAAGTILSESCVDTSGGAGYIDAAGWTYYGSFTHDVVTADGLGGSTETLDNNSGGCWYPSGYCQDTGPITDVPSGVFDDYSNEVNLLRNESATLADGSGGTIVGNVYRPYGYQISGPFSYGGSTCFLYSDGSSGFYIGY